jgi:ribosome maturation factor RimP
MSVLDGETVDLIKSVCSDESVIFHKADVQRQGRDNLIKITVDTEEGITLGQCQNLSRKISDLFFRKNVLAGNYQLEVSSPGVEKSLEFPYEYRRSIGRTLEVFHEQDGVPTCSCGELIDCEEYKIRLKVKNEEIEIPLNHIKRSYVKLQW